jgi:hypothetical protein
MSEKLNLISYLLSSRSRIVISPKWVADSTNTEQRPWVVLTSESDHHTAIFKMNPPAVEIHEIRFNPDGSQRVNTSFSLDTTPWKAIAFEEYPEGTSNFFLVLNPGVKPKAMSEFFSLALVKYGKNGCLWNFTDAVGGHLSIGIPNAHNIAGWDIEDAKECINFSEPDKEERIPVNDILKGIQEKQAEARLSLSEVDNPLELVEESAELAKTKLTYSNVSFNAPYSKFDGNWKEWDKKITDVFILKKRKSKAETYIRLCEVKLKREKYKDQGKFLGYNGVMMEKVRCVRNDVPLYSSP